MPHLEVRVADERGVGRDGGAALRAGARDRDRDGAALGRLALCATTITTTAAHRQFIGLTPAVRQTRLVVDDNTHTTAAFSVSTRTFFEHGVRRLLYRAGIWSK